MGFFSDVTKMGGGSGGDDAPMSRGVLEFIGGGVAKEPTIDPRTAALTQAQVDEFQRFQQLSKQLTPQQLRLLGIGEGFISEEAGLEEQTRIGNLRRLQSALAGDVPSPGLERDIEHERALLQESIARRGQQRGTAEAQRQGRFLEASLIARENARNQQIQQSGALNLQQAGVLGQRVQQLGAIPQQQAGLIQAGGIPIQSLEAQRGVQTQFELAALQQRMQTEKNLFDLGGSFASMG
jgi:hypothetical protein